MIRSQFGWVLILVELHVIQHQAYQWLRANGGDKPRMNEFYFVVTKARKLKNTSQVTGQPLILASLIKLISCAVET